jgi:hypothetical protein
VFEFKFPVSQDCRVSQVGCSKVGRKHFTANSSPLKRSLPARKAASSISGIRVP